MSNNTLVVNVHSRHLKDNYYHHSKDRICPLGEALNEKLGHDKYFVGGSTVRVEDISEDPKYKIPSEWNSNSVEAYIKRANDGEEFEVEVILEEIHRSPAE